MENAIYRVLGGRVREERQRAGLTLERLAELAGISGAFVSHIEAGRKNATLKTVGKIARAMGVSVSELVAEPSEIGGDRRKDWLYLRHFERLIRGKTARQKDAILQIIKLALNLSNP